MQPFANTTVKGVIDMKVEQACRFRTEVGHGITGRSAGFDKAQEDALADLFNDSMIPVFPKLGASLMTCAVKGAYAFYARNTLRSQENREIIFTHSYIMPVEAYTLALQKIPERLLAVPMSQMMNVQSCGMDMETPDFPWDQYEPLDLEAIFQKYNLTPQRYAQLMAGAYEAMTSNRSLRLYTKQTLEHTEQMVRELVYCIVEGLLPIMKGHMTFSSGNDARMNVSVIHAGSRGPQSGDLVFGVEDPNVTNIRARDELSGTFFTALGQIGHMERRELLQRMEDWLRNIVDVKAGISIQLMAAAYCYCCNRSISHSVKIALFCSLAKAAGDSLSLDKANVLLVNLVQNMLDEHSISTEALSYIAEWYLGQSSEMFRRVADQALACASADICVALIQAAIGLPANNNVFELVTTLVNLIPLNAPELTEEVKTQLVCWIIGKNVVSLAACCDVILDGYTLEQQMGLSRSILTDAGKMPLNDAQTALLMRTLDRAVQDPNCPCLSEEEWKMLESHMVEFAAEDLVTTATYILMVRAKANATMNKLVDWLVELGQTHDQLQPRMNAVIANGTHGQETYQQLWEHYQIKVVFAPGVTGDQVPQLLRQYNTFQYPNSPFEKKAISLWITYVKEQLKAAQDPESPIKGLSKRNELAAAFLSQSGALEALHQSREVAKSAVINSFWELVTFKEIVSCAYQVKIKHELKAGPPHLKLNFSTICGRLMASPEGTHEMVALVMDSSLSHADRKTIQGLMLELAWRAICKHRVILWDLLLLYAWEEEENFNFEALNNMASYLQEQINKEYLNNLQPSADFSSLLQQPALRKTFIKKMDSNVWEVPAIVEDLLKELKSAKRLRGGRRAGTGYTPPFSTAPQDEPEEKGLLNKLFGRGRK